MKIVGIDYGEKRIGIAVSDQGGTIAFPREVIHNNDGAIAHIVQLVQQEDVKRFVIGDTRASSGRSNAITAEAEEFAMRIARATGKPVARAYELGSSVEASRYAPKGKQHEDAAAAAIILQRYLDMNAANIDA